ncbi:hypothetical protein EHI_078850 [Entamoeba histolytica HM-1:IMSS]|uniref:S1 motif domain-containing protein n=1 Tax=Entamoeba histolytica (strain ATCC 30459 / HM-1:IMSS / ABRM) TaxID=294381 RepID=C4MBS9_ENTH1|nr:hypothetical protein EHI_078850 [Entamoeba histolytica HM-1:IMSS]EAL42545.1 hypothetical protein EHI_078850 [Entamoeba histolytica HM-1:IMSS]|eukprot:XP_647931.1 hypothetical protein EHI_078850 [Entamoeba histolytica HM-1:IMSS]
MYYSAFDGYCGITTRESILSDKYQSIFDIKSGMIIEGTIKEVNEKGIIVKIGEKIYGFCDKINSGDIPIEDLQSVFKKEQKSKFRVLTVNNRNNSIYLTHKRTLMKATTLFLSRNRTFTRLITFNSHNTIISELFNYQYFLVDTSDRLSQYNICINEKELYNIALK